MIKLYQRDHIDLKPENLLFRTKAEDADIMIADFGLSRVLDEEKFQLLHEVCGTPGVSSIGVSPIVGLMGSFIVYGSGDFQERYTKILCLE